MSEPSAIESHPDQPADRSRNLGVRSLMVIVACAGAVLWSYRSITDRQPTRAFLKSLQDGTVEERRSAARDWNPDHGELKVVVPALERASTDPDPGVRTSAILSMAMIGSESIRKASVTVPPDPLQADRDRAIESARRVALDALEDPDRDVRVQGLNALSVLLSRWRSIGLTSRATGNQPIEIDPKPYLSRVLATLDDSDASVRDVAARVLVFFPRSLGPVLPRLFADVEREPETATGSGWSGARQALFSAKPGPLSVPLLVGFLKSPRRMIRSHAALLLEQVGPEAYPATPALVVTLGEPWDATSRSGTRDDPVEAAAWALSTVAPKTPESSRAIAGLTELLGSPIGPRRAAAARALWNFGPDAAVAVPRLVSNLKRSLSSLQALDDDIVSATALGIVAPVSGPLDDVVSILVEATHRGYEPLIIAAIESLGRLGPRASAALPRLRDLDSTNPQLQSVIRPAIQAIERPNVVASP